MVSLRILLRSRSDKSNGCDPNVPFRIKDCYLGRKSDTRFVYRKPFEFESHDACSYQTLAPIKENQAQVDV